MSEEPTVITYFIHSFEDSNGEEIIGDIYTDVTEVKLVNNVILLSYLTEKVDGMIYPSTDIIPINNVARIELQGVHMTH